MGPVIPPAPAPPRRWAKPGTGWPGAPGRGSDLPRACRAGRSLPSPPCWSPARPSGPGSSPSGSARRCAGAWSWRPVGLVIITRHQAQAIGPDRQVNPLLLRQGRGTALSPAPSGVLAGLADQWLTGGHSGDLVSFRGAGSKAIVLRGEMRPLKTEGMVRVTRQGKTGGWRPRAGPAGGFRRSR